MTTEELIANIKDKNMKARLATVFKNGNIKSTEQLSEMNAYDLSKIRGCGINCIGIIINLMESKGMSIRVSSEYGDKSWTVHCKPMKVLSI